MKTKEKIDRSNMEFSLTAFHHPIGEGPSFLLPLFIGQPKNSLFYQIKLLFEEIIGNFESLEEDLGLLQLAKEANLITSVGLPTVYAFTLGLDPIFGTREAIFRQIDDLIYHHDVANLPLLRLEMAEFCNNLDKIESSVKDSYSYLQSLSEYSADHWRDFTLLTARAKQILGSELHQATGMSDSGIVLLLDEIQLRLQKDVALCLVEDAVASKLSESLGPEWTRRLRDKLQVYLQPLTKLRTSVALELCLKEPSDAARSAEEPADEARDASDDVERREHSAARSPIVEVSSSKMMGLEQRSQVLWMPFGERIDRVARSATQRRRMAAFGRSIVRLASLEEDNLQRFSVSDRIEMVNRLLRGAKSSTTVLVVFDLLDDKIDQALEFALSVQSVDVVCVAIVRPNSKHNSISPYDFMIESIAYVAREVPFILCVNNEFPASGGIRDTPESSILLALMETLACLDGEESLLPALYLFATGSATGGRVEWPGALRRALLATGNPILDLGKADRVSVVVSSVGRMGEGEYVELLDTAQRSFDPLRNVDVLTKYWHQKRYIPGATIPISVSFMYHNLDVLLEERKDKISNITRSSLKILGFEVDIVNNHQFFIKNSSGARLEAFIETPPDERSEDAMVVVGGADQQRYYNAGFLEDLKMPALLYRDLFQLSDDEDNLAEYVELTALLSLSPRQWRPRVEKMISTRMYEKMRSGAYTISKRVLQVDFTDSIKFDKIKKRSRVDVMFSGVLLSARLEINTDRFSSGSISDIRFDGIYSVWGLDVNFFDISPDGFV